MRNVAQVRVVVVVAVGAFATSAEAPHRAGEARGDGDVELDDWSGFAGCLTGPMGSLGGGCECADRDDDNDADLRDVAHAQTGFGT